MNAYWISYWRHYTPHYKSHRLDSAFCVPNLSRAATGPTLALNAPWPASFSAHTRYSYSWPSCTLASRWVVSAALSRCASGTNLPSAASSHQHAHDNSSRPIYRKHLMTILRLSCDNATVTIDLRRTSNLQNTLREWVSEWVRGFV